MKSLRMRKSISFLALAAFLMFPGVVFSQSEISDAQLNFDIPSLNLSGLSAIEDDLAQMTDRQLAQSDAVTTDSQTSATAESSASNSVLQANIPAQSSAQQVTVEASDEYRLIVGTSPVTQITNESARLTGYLAPGGEVTDSYFAYGETVDMGQETDRIRRSTSGLIQATITELKPGTRYYVQHCATNIQDDQCGIVISFVTATSPDAAEVGNNAETTEDGAIIEYFEVIVPVPSSFVSLAIQNGVAAMQTGDIVTYEVKYANESGRTLRDGTLFVELPADLNFLDTTRGDYSEVDHAVSYDFGIIGNDERGTIFITMELPALEDEDVPVIAVAHLSHQNPDNTARETATSYDVDTRYHTLSEERAAALAASAFGSGVESTLVITLMAVLAILLVIYYLQSIGMIGSKVVYRTVHVPAAQPAPAYAGVRPHQRIDNFDAIPHPPALVDEVHEADHYYNEYRGHLGE